MAHPSHPLRFVLVALAGWINQQQRDVVDSNGTKTARSLDDHRPLFEFDAAD